MAVDNLVIFKGTANGIIVQLDAKVPFETLLKSFEYKLHHAQKFFKDANVSMRFTGRELAPAEQEQLLQLLKDQHILDISFIHDFSNKPTSTLRKREERAKKEEPAMESHVVSGIVSPTQFHYGIIRSGQELNTEGSVVVVGDVNPGGSIKAGGNVIVLGTLKGKVHIGLNEHIKVPFVAALSMQPSQIGIKTTIAQTPSDSNLFHKKPYTPQVAYMQEGQIYIDEMDMKTIYHMIQ